ncbi:MAG: heme o synthase [Candidatus Zixiibacteriota bacterium]
MNKISAYFQLTKPKIMILVLAGGATSLFMEGSLVGKPFDFLIFIIALYLTGGCANALNQYFERDIDAQMSRTAGRRPLPLGKLSNREALAFSIGIGIIGVSILLLTFNLLTALLAVGTILFYSLFYTLWLKPNTNQNIVIGGIAGAMAPVGAWTAASGSMALQPWLLFLIIFFWTPPHFWALAHQYRNDYKITGLPMLPVTNGLESTLNQIFVYTLLLFVSSIILLAINFGWFYFGSVSLLGPLFLIKAYRARKYKNTVLIWAMFKYSIFYLFGIFISLMLDAII